MIVVIGAGLVVTIIVVIAVRSRGSDSPSPSSAAQPQSNANICVSRWNSGATPSARSEAGSFATLGGGTAQYTYVSVGSSALVPDRCLVTIANVDFGQVLQFQEKTGGVFDYPSGSGALSDLPESARQWVARGDRAGVITMGAP